MENHLGSSHKFVKICVHEVERGSFTPIVFSMPGGIRRSATVAYKRLASLFAKKHELPYGAVMAWLTCRLLFSKLRPAVMCLRDFNAVMCRALPWM